MTLTNTLGKTVNILLVEDNPGDARLTTEAFQEARVKHNLYIVKDGEEALLFLRHQAPFQGSLSPDIVLLDLNLPRIDGLEVLSVIKNDPKLKRIPVIILTTSRAETDILKAYDLHANCCITKPVDFNQFLDVVKTIERFWLTIVHLPPH